MAIRAFIQKFVRIQFRSIFCLRATIKSELMLPSRSPSSPDGSLNTQHSIRSIQSACRIKSTYKNRRSVIFSPVPWARARNSYRTSDIILFTWALMCLLYLRSTAHTCTHDECQYKYYVHSILNRIAFSISDEMSVCVCVCCVRSRARGRAKSYMCDVRT